MVAARATRRRLEKARVICSDYFERWRRGGAGRGWGEDACGGWARVAAKIEIGKAAGSAHESSSQQLAGTRFDVRPLPAPKA
ncbi:hypothetical protein AcV7_005600 [Taiwanofungus camphoratus]|nr:hypothetical protein AcV7_005600 [Antrodia cinnamomea]